MLKAAELYTQVLFACLVCGLSFCAPTFGANINSEIRQKEEIVRALRDEIIQIESETMRCEKSKKGWIAATVIGGTGVVATGTAAIVQGVKLKEQKNSKKETKETKEENK